MALLLAMYQKMRLIREKNQLVLDQTKVSSKLTRVQKNIELVQKRYKSREASLDAIAKRMTSNASLFFKMNAGLGSNDVNTNMYNFGLNFNNSIIMNTMQAALTGDKNNGGAGWDQQKFSEVMSYFQSCGGNPQQLYSEPDADGKRTPKYAADGKTPLYCESPEITANDIAQFRQAMTLGNMELNNRQNTCTQLDHQYQNNVSIWLEAQKAELEAEQDAALEPLNYEDTMLQLEKEQKDARLQRINTEIETYTQLVSQEAKNSAPTFGLA